MTQDRRKRLANQGLMGSTVNKRRQAKKVGSPGPLVGGKMGTESWVNLALTDTYTDTNGLWGEVKTTGWRPSGMGEECDRKSVLGMLGYRGDLISTDLRRIFDMGNAVETLWRKYFTEMGILLSANIRLTREADPAISGEYDLMVKHPYEPGRRFIVEIKSINTSGFAKLPPVTMDPERNFIGLTTMTDKLLRRRIKNYVLQLQMYMRLTGLGEGILLFSNKNDSKYADYHLLQVPEMVEDEFARLRRRDGYRSRLVVPPCSCIGAKEGLCAHGTDVEMELDVVKNLTAELEMV